MDPAQRMKAAKADLLAGRWERDPDLRSQTDWILSLPPIERLRLIDADIELFNSIRRAD